MYKSMRLTGELCECTPCPARPQLFYGIGLKLDGVVIGVKREERMVFREERYTALKV